MEQKTIFYKIIKPFSLLILFSLMIYIPSFAGTVLADQSKSIVIAQSTDAQSLDPAFRTDTATGNVQRHIFDTILSRDADMGISPQLAVSYEQLNETKWSIKLRKDVKFSNGEPFDASAVKFSVERILDPKTKSPAKRWWSNFVKVDVIDKYTVEITTKARDPLFLARLSLLMVVPPQYLQKVGDTGFSLHPIGTGPYILEEWRRDDRVTLKANPNYWKGKPAIKKVEFRVVPELLSRVAALQTGEADLIVSVSPSQANHLKTLKHVNVKMTPSTRVMVVQFDDKISPGNQLPFRQAIAHAINRDLIINGLLKGFGGAVTSIFSPGIPGWPKDQDTTFPYDPEKAKKLVSQHNLGKTEIVMRTPAGRYPNDKETALAVAQQLRNVGLNIKVQADEFGKFFQDLKNQTMSAVYLMGQGNVWVDPFPQLDAFHASKGFISTWHDPTLDSFLDDSHLVKGKERVKIFGKALARLHDQVGAVPLYAQVFIYGVNKRIIWEPRIDNVLLALEMDLASK